jgi:hypothetical protein
MFQLIDNAADSVNLPAPFGFKCQRYETGRDFTFGENELSAWIGANNRIIRVKILFYAIWSA